MALPPYRGRLAPSPTGLLHLGHAATFWQAFIRARDQNGKLLLRVEDLDPHRSKPRFTEAILEDLTWLGISCDPLILYQSQRLPLYREALNQLFITGQIYPCHCSRKDLAAMMHAPHEDADDEPVYPGTCRLGPNAARPSFQHGINYRFRVPDGETVGFADKNLGSQSFTAGKDFGDFLIWRKDGLPSYQLACVVDDADTHITEVVRGRDLLKSTARQILLQRSLRLCTPTYFHTPLMLDAQGHRLAKRHDALSLRTLRESGATPQQIIDRISQPL